jgi:hypothetical protein
VDEARPNLATRMHRRMAHMHIHGIRMCVKEGRIDGFEGSLRELQEDPDFCEACALGKSQRKPKQKRKKQRKAEEKAANDGGLLDLVHSDLSGAKRVSVGGTVLFSMNVDHRSRKKFIIPLKSKAEFPDKYMELEMRLERQLERTVGKFRSDNEAVMTTKSLHRHFAAKGTQVQTSSPYSSFGNGVAERAIRTVTEGGTTMMIDSGMPLIYWIYAFLCFVYVSNKGFSSVVDRTPDEIFEGKRTTWKGLAPFGCVAYAHRFPRAPKGCLPEKAERCVMMGYSETSADAYVLLRIRDRRVIERRDVDFDENVFPFRTMDAEMERIDPELGVADPDVDVESEQEDEDDGSESAADSDEEPVADLGEPAADLGVDEPAAEPNPVEHGERAEPAGNEDRGNEVEPVRRSRRLRQSTRDDATYVYVMDDEEAGLEQELLAMIDAQDVGGLVTRMLAIVPDTPQTTREALEGPQRKQWLKAMIEELEQHIKLRVYDLVRLPDDRRAIGTKWVHKIKLNEDGTIERFRARLTALGYQQVAGLDYGETFAPVARAKATRVALTIGATEDMEIDGFDVKGAFLRGAIDKAENEVYVKQPKGFEKPGKEDWVWRLRKSMPGTKQAARGWNKEFDSTMCELGFTPTGADPCLYHIRRPGRKIILVSMHVDDGFLIYDKTDAFAVNIKQKLYAAYEMSATGPLQYALGIRFTRDRENRTITLDQRKFIRECMEKNGVARMSAIPAHPKTFLTRSVGQEQEQIEQEGYGGRDYRAEVGSLTWLSIMTRPELSLSVGQVARYVTNPGVQHWNAIDLIWEYLNGSSEMGLTLGGGDAELSNLRGFVDSDYARCVDTRRSTTGWVFKFGGGAVSWRTRRQKSVTLSSTEAEYCALTEAAKEAIWMKGLLRELGYGNDDGPVPLYEDNKGAICLAKNDVYHERTKHIDVRHHFIRECVAKKQIVIDFRSSKTMVADILTKPLSKVLFRRHRHQLLGL